MWKKIQVGKNWSGKLHKYKVLGQGRELNFSAFTFPLGGGGGGGGGGVGAGAYLNGAVAPPGLRVTVVTIIDGGRGVGLRPRVPAVGLGLQ